MILDHMIFNIYPPLRVLRSVLRVAEHCRPPSFCLSRAEKAEVLGTWVGMITKM